jgi:hypothetical protein
MLIRRASRPFLMVRWRRSAIHGPSCFKRCLVGRVVGVDEGPKLLTAAELDQMSPDERALALRAGIVKELDELPADFRQRVTATAEVLAEQRQARSNE